MNTRCNKTLSSSLVLLGAAVLGFGSIATTVCQAADGTASAKVGRILEQLRAGSDGKTPTVKDFTADWAATLDQRGQPTVYTRENSKDFEYIGMPIGGIGAGLLYLGGDGKLWGWNVFNTKATGQAPQEYAYRIPYARSNTNNPILHSINQGFAIRLNQDGKLATRTLDRDGFKDIRFRGEYPLGRVSYADPACPVQVELEAFSPFCPLNVEDSSYPATVLIYTVKNTSDRKVSGDLAGWLQNAVCLESGKQKPSEVNRRNLVMSSPLVSFVLFSANMPASPGAKPGAPAEWLAGQHDYGTMALALVERKSEVRASADFKASGDGVNEAVVEADRPCGEPAPVGVLARPFTLKPGQSITARFVLSWYFPRFRRENLRTGTDRGYGERFASAFEVAGAVAGRVDELAATTRLWHDTWYDSTLPWWFLDRTFINTCILASNTSLLLSGGRFFGYEGEYLGYGTCTHVWGYSQAMGRLFPALERSLREKVEFNSKVGYDERTGGIGQRAEQCMDPADDGQASIILRTLLTHQMQPDNRFLAGIYPQMKKAMNYLVTTKDADRDGIMTKDQMNTLDARWYGKIAWLSLHYQAALRAAAVMAEVMGEPDVAKEWREIADRGRGYIEKSLYNGDYFIQEPDPAKPDSPGTYTGCHVDQLLGQSWAYQLGLGEIIDPAKARQAMESIWRYNLTTDVGPYRKAFTGGRWYAMPGEGGLVMCSWPRGGMEVLQKGHSFFANYLNECMSGFEYAFSSLMMRDGMPYRSLAHTRLMCERYDAAKRNPWNEVEWGSFYARAMASYGVFTSASGFEYDGPKGSIAFSPKITPDKFKAAFTSAEGWGSFEQVRDGQAQRGTITVKHGQLRLKQLAFDIPSGAKVTSVKVGGFLWSRAHEVRQEGARVQVILATPVVLKAGQDLAVRIHYKQE